MKKNQNGFSVVEGLLILAIVGIIGVLGWYVWQKQSTNKVTPASTSSNTTTKLTPKTRHVSLTETKLLAGWMVELNEPERVLVRNSVPDPVN